MVILPAGVGFFETALVIYEPYLAGHCFCGSCYISIERKRKPITEDIEETEVMIIEAIVIEIYIDIKFGVKEDTEETGAKSNKEILYQRHTDVEIGMEEDTEETGAKSNKEILYQRHTDVEIGIEGEITNTATTESNAAATEQRLKHRVLSNTAIDDGVTNDDKTTCLIPKEMKEKTIEESGQTAKQDCEEYSYGKLNPLAFPTQNEYFKKFQDICQKFENHMDDIENGLINKSWVGYKSHTDKTNLENIRIVALLSRQPGNALPRYFENIQIYWRHKDEVSSESRKIFGQEKIHKGIGIDTREIENLFSKYSNLNMVHSSSFRSSKVSREHKITEENCIVLYCRIKGIIPLREDTFPTAINGIKTDVREGYCNLAADECIQQGGKIICLHNYGSICGFVYTPEREQAFITAAHVVAQGEILGKNEEQQKEYFKNNYIPVQMAKKPEHHLGNVLKWCFKSDDAEQTSVDVALVKLQSECHLAGIKFPYKFQNVCQKPEILYSRRESATSPKDNGIKCSNKILTIEEIHANKHLKVVKYAAATGFTIGKMEDLQYIRPEYDRPCTMYNQMRVCSTDESDFCQKGDSGGCCFMADVSDKILLRPFGMIIAVTHSGDAVVTPLIDIFHELDLDIENGMIALPVNLCDTEKENLRLLITGLKNKMQHGDESTNAELKKRDKETNDKFDRMEEKINDKFDRMEEKINKILEILNQ